jgi:putative transposase
MTHDANVTLIKGAFLRVIKRHVFRICAFVLLHDHVHSIWTFPENDNDFSMR